MWGACRGFPLNFEPYLVTLAPGAHSTGDAPPFFIPAGTPAKTLAPASEAPFLYIRHAFSERNRGDRERHRAERERRKTSTKTATKKTSTKTVTKKITRAPKGTKKTQKAAAKKPDAEYEVLAAGDVRRAPGGDQVGR